MEYQDGVSNWIAFYMIFAELITQKKKTHTTVMCTHITLKDRTAILHQAWFERERRNHFSQARKGRLASWAFGQCTVGRSDCFCRGGGGGGTRIPG